MTPLSALIARVEEGSKPSLFRKLVLCPLKLCSTFRTEGDETHLWGECTLCGKQAGKIDRASVRRHMVIEDLASGRLMRPSPALLAEHIAELSKPDGIIWAPEGWLLDDYMDYVRAAARAIQSKEGQS